MFDGQDEGGKENVKIIGPQNGRHDTAGRVPSVWPFARMNLNSQLSKIAEPKKVHLEIFKISARRIERSSMQ